MRKAFVLLLIFISPAISAAAQETPTRMSLEDVARLARVRSVADVLRRDLPSYCFPALTPDAEQEIISAVRSFDRMADAGLVLNHIRQHPCPTAPVAQRESPQPQRETPQPQRERETRVPGGRQTADREPTGNPGVPSGEGAASPIPLRLYVTPDNKCAVNRPPANPRDLRIPRYLEYIYVFLQTHGPVEEAESERVVNAMPKDEFVKCFEAFRELARSRNMRLIITATDRAHRSWEQPQIIFRGRHLQEADYKSPYEERVFPGAEVPLDP